jgi:hypothetical protein
VAEVTFEIELDVDNAPTDFAPYKRAIAASIPDVEANQVEIVVKSTTRLRRLAAGITLEVTIKTATIDAADTISSFVSASSYTATLGTEMVAEAITAAVTVSASSVSTVYLVVPPSPPPAASPAEEEEATGGGAAGPAAGGAVAVLLLAALIWWYRSKQTKKDAKAKVYSEPAAGTEPPTKEAVHPSVTGVQTVVPVSTNDPSPDEESKQEELEDYDAAAEEAVAVAPTASAVLAPPSLVENDLGSDDEDEDLDDLDGLNILGPPAAFGEEWMDEDTPPGTPDDA